MNRTTITTIFMCLLSFSSAAWCASITNSKHDLSKDSNAPYKVDFTGTEMICIFCHSPHRPTVPAPLWNRFPGLVPLDSYRLYSSSPTMRNVSNSSGIAPSSQSALCLDCHDGTPLGGASLRVQPVDGNSNVLGPTGEPGISAGRPSRFGTNLREHHPVNFNVTVSGQEHRLGDIVTVNGQPSMKTAGATKALPLFTSSRGNQTLECSTCHSLHDPLNPSFLRLPLEGGMLCRACHIP